MKHFYTVVTNPSVEKAKQTIETIINSMTITSLHSFALSIKNISSTEEFFENQNILARIKVFYFVL